VFRIITTQRLAELTTAAKKLPSVERQRDAALAGAGELGELLGKAEETERALSRQLEQVRANAESTDAMWHKVEQEADQLSLMVEYLEKLLVTKPDLTRVATRVFELYGNEGAGNVMAGLAARVLLDAAAQYSDEQLLHRPELRMVRILNLLLEAGREAGEQAAAAPVSSENESPTAEIAAVEQRIYETRKRFIDCADEPEQRVLLAVAIRRDAERLDRLQQAG
jgi:hypothetical protein